MVSTRQSLAVLVAVCVCLQAAAQDWPTGPLRLIVPYGAGSRPDIVSRMIGVRLAPRLGRPVVVENKPGASGNIGTDAVAKAKPDGQTIGMSIAGPLGVNALLFKGLPYDPARDLAPVTIAAMQPSVLVVTNKLGVASAQELLARLRAEPGKYNYASMGSGSISHLAMEAIAARSGTEVVHVAYNGSGPALLALLAGDVDMACLPAATVVPQVKAGKLKALAVATAQRSSILPDVPTLAESGLRDVHADAWMGIVVPSATPAPIVRRLHDEIAAVLGSPDVRDRLRAQYMEVVASTPEEFRAVMQSDLARWRPIIEKHHITAE